MFECYGHWNAKKEKCHDCACRKYCVQAGDPELMTVHSPSPFRNQTILNRQYGADRHTASRDSRSYSREDLLEVIGFMASLDFRTLNVLDTKIRDPTLNLSDLAEKSGLSRQNFHKQLQSRLVKVPELEKIITYRKKQQKKNNQTTFLEEVCQIRRKMQECRLKKQKSVSNSLKKWNCLNPSLLSSPMNIIKGNAIWRNDSL